MARWVDSGDGCAVHASPVGPSRRPVPRSARRLCAWLLLTLALSPPGASAQGAAEDPGAEAGPRPRVALVLGGGGARGLSHLGVLQRLEELRVPVDLVVGTSMGAIIGALYASGWTCPELEAWLREADWADLFRDQPAYRDLSFRRKRDMLAFPIHLELGLSRRGLSTPSGLIAGQKLNAELRRLLLPVATISDFDRLPLPFRAIATDLETGEMVVLSRGDLVDAVRASMTAPGVFSPYELDGRLLVDGGLTRNLPTDVARAAGADVLIVVDVGTPLYTREELTTPVRAARQVATMLVESSAADQRRGLTAADVLIEPDLGPVGATDFGRWREALAAGRQAADEMAEALRTLAVPAAEYDAWRARRRPPENLPPVVDFVVLGEAGDRTQVSMLPRLRMVSGGPLDTAAIREDIVRLYGLGIYERVDYRLMWNGSDLALVYDPRPKPWGPNFLRFRVGVADNLAGEGSFTLAASLRVPQLNAWGGELITGAEIGTTRRLRLELYQPLGPGSALFLAPYTQARVSPTDQYLDGRVVTRYQTETRAGGVALGVELGHWADARVGIEHGHVNARPRIGEPGRPTIHAELGRVYAQLEVNWLDDPLFPRSGMAAGVLFRSERADLGATHPHQRLLLDILMPVTFGRVTVVTGAVAGTALRASLPAHEPFGLGGFLMMTGYPAGELVGSHMLLGRVIVFRDLVPDRVFAGVAFEGGNTWLTRDAVSPGDLRYSVAPMAGFRTPLGPLYLGYGFGEGGRRQATVSIGRSATPRDYFP